MKRREFQVGDRVHVHHSRPNASTAAGKTGVVLEKAGPVLMGPPLDVRPSWWGSREWKPRKQKSCFKYRVEIEGRVYIVVDGHDGFRLEAAA